MALLLCSNLSSSNFNCITRFIDYFFLGPVPLLLQAMRTPFFGLYNYTKFIKGNNNAIK